MEEKRKTPIQKFRLRNSRTPKLNATITSASQGNTSNPNNFSRRQNLDSTICALSTGTVRQNLDSTICTSSVSNPRIKSALTTGNPEFELDCILDYNEYLQATLKHQIVTKIVEQQQLALKEQLIIQEDVCNKMKNRCENVHSDLQQLEEESNVIEIIDLLQKSISDLNSLLMSSETETEIHDCKNLLNSLCNKVQFKNIKKINTQEDYDNLLNKIENCLSKLKQTEQSGHNSEAVHNLAETMKMLVNLKNSNKEKQLNICSLQKKTTYELLQNASDMFCQKEGYLLNDVQN